jgi:hypothetical protein
VALPGKRLSSSKASSAGSCNAEGVEAVEVVIVSSRSMTGVEQSRGKAKEGVNGRSHNCEGEEGSL